MIGVLGDWSPSQDSNHPDDLFQSRYVTPGFKPFSYIFFTCHVLSYRGFQLPMANYSKCMKEVQSGEIDVGSSYRQSTEHRSNQGTELKIGVSL